MHESKTGLFIEAPRLHLEWVELLIDILASREELSKDAIKANLIAHAELVARSSLRQLERLPAETKMPEPDEC